MKSSSADPEEFARKIDDEEEGGKALAAILKPREKGRTRRPIGGRRVVKTIGQVADLAGAIAARARTAIKPWQSLSRLWAKRSAHGRRAGEPSREPDPRDKRCCRSRVVEPNSLRGFYQASLALDGAMGRAGWCARPKRSTRITGIKPMSISARLRTRSRRPISCSPTGALRETA